MILSNDSFTHIFHDNVTNNQTYAGKVTLCKKKINKSQEYAYELNLHM